MHNRSIDRRPGAIARCTDVADVITGIRLPRKGDTLVSLRGGGHNGAGLGVCNGGLVIDMSAKGFGTNASCYRDHFSLLVERARPARR